MDGNGRWASQRGLPRVMGHRAGVEALRKIIEVSLDIRLKYLTIYAFSTENWKRPTNEVKALMGLLVEYIERELVDLHQKGIKIKPIGDLTALPPKVLVKVEEAVKRTKQNQKLVLQIALNYGGRKEILNAVQKIAQQVAIREIAPTEINEALITEYLYTKGIPEPDLLIRTAGELRLSNFLLWQTAYTEFWFTDVFWPDFTPEHFYQAIKDYSQRQRRFGGLQEN